LNAGEIPVKEFGYENEGKAWAIAITAEVIAVVVKYSMASQFRFGYLAVIIIKLKFYEVKLS
jgi:hypothetical protein